MRKALQIVGNSKYGGASYLILKWCEYLSSEGWDVHVLATDVYFCSLIKTLPNIKLIEGIFIPRDIELVQDFRAFVEIFSLIKQENYDVVHTYTATPSFLGRIAAWLAKVPVIVHHQAGWTVTEFSSVWERLLYTPLEYLAASVSTASICVSNAVQAEGIRLKLAPQRKLDTICNGIDARPYLLSNNPITRQKIRVELGFSSNSIVIGSIGRLSDQKDYGTFIKAIKLLKPSCPHKIFRFVLVGDGPDKEKLSSIAESLHITNSELLFLGFREDVPDLLSGIDIFVTTSLREGLSISLLEAMAASRSIVATSISPNAELIEHEKTGLLVDPQAPDQIVRAIVRYVSEPDLAIQCGLNAQKEILENYSIDRMFRETEDLYTRSLIGSAG